MRHLIGLLLVAALLGGCRRHETTYKGKSAAQWIAQTEDADLDTNTAGWEALAYFPNDAAAQSRLRNGLSTFEERVQVIAADAMATADPPAATAALRSVLKTMQGAYATNPHFKSAVTKLGTNAAQLLPDLRAAQAADRTETGRQNLQAVIDQIGNPQGR